MASDLPLFDRPGLPDEVALLRAAYPRGVWEGHRHLGPMARFWLERHQMFRDLGGAITGAADQLRDGQIEAHAFMGWFAPRINFFLNELHTHHGVEDEHYFPLFRAADHRLGRGFDILDADHHVIDGLIHELAADANALAAALKGTGEIARAAETLAARLHKTLGGLIRHLDDEEEIIIPLILDRTEGVLGV